MDADPAIVAVVAASSGGAQEPEWNVTLGGVLISLAVVFGLALAVVAACWAYTQTGMTPKR